MHHFNFFSDESFYDDLFGNFIWFQEPLIAYVVNELLLRIVNKIYLSTISYGMLFVTEVQCKWIICYAFLDYTTRV